MKLSNFTWLFRSTWYWLKSPTQLNSAELEGPKWLPYIVWPLVLSTSSLLLHMLLSLTKLIILWCLSLLERKETETTSLLKTWPIPFLLPSKGPLPLPVAPFYFPAAMRWAALAHYSLLLPYKPRSMEPIYHRLKPLNDSQKSTFL
jgi:hypothetical protein